MEVVVTNVDKVAGHVLFKGATHVISILHGHEWDELKMPRMFPRAHWLKVPADDVIHATAECAPTKDQVETVLNWVKTLPTDAKLVVHCFAGVSRSTAMALAIKVQELGVDKVGEAIEWLVDHRPQACPNPVITKFADEILGANGELHDSAEIVASNHLLKMWN